MRRMLLCTLVAVVLVSQATFVCAQTKGTPLVGSPPLLRAGKLIIAINATIPPVQYIDEKEISGECVLSWAMRSHGA